MMSDHKARNGTLGAILGALIAVAFAIFLLSGGEHVGKKTVNSDADLPPFARGKGKKQKFARGTPRDATRRGRRAGRLRVVRRGGWGVASAKTNRAARMSAPLRAGQGMRGRGRSMLPRRR